MSRIQLTDTLFEGITKVCEGNPGAMVCLTGVLKKKDWYNGCDGFLYMLAIDTLELYGEKLYMLWNDCCDRDFEKLEVVFRNWQMGKLSKDEIHEHIADGWGSPFEDLVPLDKLYDFKV